MGRYFWGDTEPEHSKVETASRQERNQRPRYEWPPEVVSSALLGKISTVDFSVKEAHFIRNIKSAQTEGKTLFGSGFLIAEKAAAEKAAAVSRQVWTLSEEERDIVRSLGEEERAWQAGQEKI